MDRMAELNQPLFQFTNDVDIHMVNTLMHGRPYLMVKWTEIWAVQRQ